MRVAMMTLAVALMAGAVAAQSTVLVDYEAHISISGEVVRSESGTHYFGPGALYRHDTLVNGERMSVIVHNDGSRTEVNHTLRVGQRGPRDMPFRTPSMEMSVTAQRPPVTPTPPDGPPAHATRGQSLGEQARGPILLHGYRFDLPPTQEGMVSRVQEVWSYVHNGEFYDLEASDIATFADGRVAATSKRIISAQRVAGEGIFDVPNGIDVRDVTDVR